MKSSKRGARPAARIAPIHAVLATAALGLLVMPIAFAGAKSPEAHSSANVRTQLKSLKRRVAALESRPAPNTPSALPPSGPAAGDLTGNYPNPQIGQDSIGPAEIVDGSIESAELAFGSVGSAAIADNAVGGSEIANGSVGQADLGAQSAGAGQLKATYERVSGGTNLTANAIGQAVAACNAGDKVLGGGYAWQSEANNGTTAEIHMVSSTPNVSGGGFDNPDEWVARGSTNINNELFAWAVCIRA
jgi:hypothetical protein